MRLAEIDKEYEYRICGHTDGTPSSIPTHWTDYGAQKLFEMGKKLGRVQFDDIPWPSLPRVAFEAPPLRVARAVKAAE